MGIVEQRLKDAGIVLLEPSVPKFNYVPFTASGKTIYISGQVSRLDDKTMITGKLGGGVTVEQGYEAGRICALNILAHARTAAGGDLDRVARVLKVLGFVNSTPDFVEAPKCINGASDLLVLAFGDAGKHARSAISVASLPFGASVEVEAIIELK